MTEEYQDNIEDNIEDVSNNKIEINIDNLKEVLNKRLKILAQA